MSESVGPGHGAEAINSAEHLSTRALAHHRAGKIRTVVQQIHQHAKRHTAALCNFGKAVVGIFGSVKPALKFAQAADISERGAELMLEGKRKPSAQAMHVLGGIELQPLE